MLVFIFSPDNFDFLGTEQAQPSPLEPGEYLLPGNSTLTPPPTLVDHQAAVWRTDHWEIVPDWRGVDFYDADHNPYKISELGVEPAKDWQVGVSPITLLSASKDAAINQVNGFHAGYLLIKSNRSTQAEKDTWDFQAQIAKQISVGEQVTLAGEAFLFSAGITDRGAWATKVVAKSCTYATAAGEASALRKKHKTAITGATNQSDLDSLILVVHEDWQNLSIK